MRGWMLGYTANAHMGRTIIASLIFSGTIGLFICNLARMSVCA